MEAKCVNCKKTKPIFKRFEGEAKKRWCAGGHYTTKAACWCQECWEAWMIKYEANQREDDARNQQILADFKAGRVIQ